MTDPLEEIAVYDRRNAVLETAYPADVRRIYAVWSARTGSSRVAGEILNVLHRKDGTIDPFGLYQLDMTNLISAMRLIEMCANPSLLSDRGLCFTGGGDPLLSESEVARFESEYVA